MPDPRIRLPSDLREIVSRGEELSARGNALTEHDIERNDAFGEIQTGRGSWGWDVGVYFLECFGLVKIGSSASIRIRLPNLIASNAAPATCLGWIQARTAPSALRIERELHARFSELHEHDEWFAHKDPLSAFIVEQAEPWIVSKPERARLTMSDVLSELQDGRDPLLMLRQVGDVTETPYNTVRAWVYTYKWLPTVPVGPRCLPRVKGSVLVKLFGSGVLDSAPTATAQVHTSTELLNNS
jgi:hypothetical protein